MDRFLVDTLMLIKEQDHSSVTLTSILRWLMKSNWKKIETNLDHIQIKMRSTFGSK